MNKKLPVFRHLMTPENGQFSCTVILLSENNCVQITRMLCACAEETADQNTEICSDDVSESADKHDRSDQLAPAL